MQSRDPAKPTRDDICNSLALSARIVSRPRTSTIYMQITGPLGRKFEDRPGMSNCAEQPDDCSAGCLVIATVVMQMRHG
jgi:hypothetical protein